MKDAISHDRSSPREGRLLKAHMQHPQLGLVDILVRNISEGGMGGKCRHAVEPGDLVRIVLPNDKAADGMIVLRMGDGFGVRLNMRVDPAGVRMPVARSTHIGGYEVPYLFRPPIECRRPGLRINC